MNNDYLIHRQTQIEEYKKNESKVTPTVSTEDRFKPIENVNSLIQKLKTLLNETTALNVANLNVGNGTNTSQIIGNEINYKLNEIYSILKRLKEDYRYTGRIV